MLHFEDFSRISSFLLLGCVSYKTLEPLHISLFHISINQGSSLENPRQYKAAGMKLGLFLFHAGLRVDT